MSQVCEINSCNRAARALCHCCQQNICIIHLNEHNDVLVSQLNPLVGTVNSLESRLQAINIQRVVEVFHEKLEQWRLDAHQKIDHFFEDKSQQLDRLIVDKIDEQKDEIRYLQIKLDELIHEQQVTGEEFYRLTAMADKIEGEIDNIEGNFIQMFMHPLVLDYNLINIKGVNEYEYDLSMLSPISKSISRPEGSYGALASNDQHLLIHQAPNLCLVNENLTISKRIAWRHAMIYDICWSATLNLFIILDQKNLYFVDENTMSIEKVSTLEKRKWLSCTCCNGFLFLSTNEWGSSITKIHLNPSKKLDKQWQSPEICNKDEYIDCITNNRRKLALIIRNNSNQTIRLEIRSPETLHKIWSTVLNNVWSPKKPFHCCTFINDDWLLADYATGRLLHITRTGILKSAITYDTVPFCVTLFGSNTLAVSANDGVNFHNLNHKRTYTIFVV